MLNFDFLWKGLGLAYPQHCVYVFSRKLFLMLTDQVFIVWLLPLLLEILGIRFRGCDVINFKINFIFLIKPIYT